MNEIRTVEFNVCSKHDGLMLSACGVEPIGEPLALVQFVHGMAENKERYLPTMRFLAEHGYACIIHDHRGHGKSVRSTKDYGYFYENGDKGIVDDVRQMTELFRMLHPSQKLILFGHSMGSLIARVYAGRYGDCIDGLILSGSPGKNPAAKAGLLLTELTRIAHGSDRAISPLLIRLVSGSVSGRYKGKNEWLSRNAENVTAYERDPRCGFPFTINGYRNLLKLMLQAYDLKSPVRAELPVHFMSGADDPCAPNRKGFDEALENIRKRGARNVSGTMYEGLRHEILNEGVQRVREDLLDTVERMSSM